MLLGCPTVKHAVPYLSTLVQLESVPGSASATDDCPGAIDRAAAAASAAVSTLVEVTGAPQGERGAEADFADRRVRHVRRRGLCWKEREGSEIGQCFQMSAISFKRVFRFII